MMAEHVSGITPAPPSRNLWIYAIDPWAESSLATAVISRCILPVRWEPLRPGPVGEYVEVIDVDPSSQCVYDPVDLEQSHVVARNGLAPSEGSPQFHQQMIYAVVMTTIGNFERALGRRILWASRQTNEAGSLLSRELQYVPRLRLYPHALREANAYYSPLKKAILFGYFNAPVSDSREDLPGGMVFACLSHDIVAHETTHAILDGIHRRLLEPTNVDMLAFHEAFADIVAIFQHFTLPNLVLDQMRRTRGDLRINNLLSTLAVQFGRATQRGDALRNALGRLDADGQRLPPDPTEFAQTTEPHARGAILVAAIFDAFLRIYAARVEDLRRIATGGTGILPQGDIHPDLANRFAEEAIKVSQRILTICIRALDYLPPVDITFGDYLRALISADAEIVPDDPKRYRVAFIEAFRKRGIFPHDVRAMGEDTLRWKTLEPGEWDEVKDFLPPPDILRTMVAAWEFSHGLPMDEEAEEGLVAAKLAERQDRLRKIFLDVYWPREEFESPPGQASLGQEHPASADHRRNLCLLSQDFSRFIYLWLAVAAGSADSEKRRAAGLQFGLDFDLFNKYRRNRGWGTSLRAGASIDEHRRRDGAIEVHDVRPTFRVHPDGRTKVELLVILTQQRCEPLFPEDGPDRQCVGDQPAFYHLRGGCTLLIDPETGRVRYAISKRIGSSLRKQRIEQFLRGRLADLGEAALDQFHLRDAGGAAIEPLALLHRTSDDGAR
jgi:hypothetical protein